MERRRTLWRCGTSDRQRLHFCAVIEEVVDATMREFLIAGRNELFQGGIDGRCPENHPGQRVIDIVINT